MLPSAALAGPRCAGADTPVAELTPAGARSSLRCLIAERRRSRDLPPLRASSPLRRMALQHARDMVRAGHRDHTSSSGDDVAQRARRHLSARLRARWQLGEGLAWGSGEAFTTPAALMDALVRSRPHRRLLDDWRFSLFDVGLAARGEDAVAVVELARLRSG